MTVVWNIGRWALGLLNHTYKIVSVTLLKRLVDECSEFFSDWQTGFRPKWGCRDNVLLLRVLYEQIIKVDSKFIGILVTFIDFSAAFDTVSHNFIDRTLAKAGASRKSWAIFRAIYAAVAGIASKWNRRQLCLLWLIQRGQGSHTRG